MKSYLLVLHTLPFFRWISLFVQDVVCFGSGQFRMIWYAARKVVLFITGRNEVVAKVMFLLVSVILSTGGGVCLSACWDTSPPPRERRPPKEGDPPGRRHPLGRSPRGIRSMSGRYASYCNAFLFETKMSHSLCSPTVIKRVQDRLHSRPSAPPVKFSEFTFKERKIEISES